MAPADARVTKTAKVNSEFKGLLPWHSPAIHWLQTHCHSSDLQMAECAMRDIYTFGVLTGRTMKGVAAALNKTRVPWRLYWGFDSFQGLPEESTKVVRSKTSMSQWQPGMYSSATRLGISDEHAIQERVRNFISDPSVRLIAGYYNETLRSALVKKMRPALFVEIDCDLYISTIQALDFMLAHRLIVENTLIGYDDWSTGGKNSGEARAHWEMASKYGLRLTNLLPNHSRAIFAVRSGGQMSRKASNPRMGHQ